MHKAIIFLIIFIIGLLIYQRSKFNHPKIVHYPPIHIQSKHQNSNNYYEIGAFNHVPQLSLFDKFSRKKINNYLFMVDNHHKIEIALIDLGYIKILNANFFAKDLTFSFEEQISFKLPQNFNDFSAKFNKSGSGYKFSYQAKQTIFKDEKKAVLTQFDIEIIQKRGNYSLKLDHLQPEDSCATYLRQGVISYKCYGGQGSGEMDLSIVSNSQKIQKHLKLTSQNTIVAFDGFRASGWEWNWVWGMGTGYDTFGQHFSINFGSIRQIGEDFVYFGDKIVKINGFQYTINQNKTVGESIAFKSESPLLELQFKITAKQRKYQDMVILKSDMIKFEGYWSGFYKDPQTQNVITLQGVPGLVETADSIF